MVRIVEKISGAELVARMGADLAVVFSHMPEKEAGEAIDVFAAGLKDAAKTFRDDRNEQLRQGIG